MESKHTTGMDSEQTLGELYPLLLQVDYLTELSSSATLNQECVLFF